MILNKADCEELLDILMISDIDIAIKIASSRKFGYIDFKDNYYTNKDKWKAILKEELDSYDV